MIIHLSDLKSICEVLLVHIREVAGESIEIPVDFYWNIAKDIKYNPYEQPTDLDLGQLTDDWRELQKVLEKRNEPLSHDLVLLAAILRALGEHIIP